MEKIVLVDGYSIINRAFYGIPPLTNSQGLHTNGILGFMNIILKILDEQKPDYVTVAFDKKAPTFRHKMFKEYKGTRKKMPEELLEQVPVLQDLLNAMGISTVGMEGYEADDLLGTLARRAEAQGIDVTLVSGDRDLLQIATDKTCIWIPKTKKGGTEIEKYYTQDVIDLYGVTPAEFIDMKALMGDSSDNIPGVPGVGEKTAAALIKQFHSVEEIERRIDEVTPARVQAKVRDHMDLAKLSRVLAEIKTDCPLDFTFEEARLGNLYTQAAYDLMKRLEFKSLLSRFSSETMLAQEAENQDLKEVLFTIDQADGLRDALNKVDKASFLLLHDGADVFDADRILYAGILAGDTVWICQKGGSPGSAGALDMLLKDHKGETIKEDQEDALGLMIRILTGAKCRKLTIDLKRQLPGLSRYAEGEADVHLEKIRGEEKLAYEDLSLMAYLLNPLKDSYDFDDLARDYLDRMITSRKDVLGKLTIQKAAAEKPEELKQMMRLALQVIRDAYPVLLKKLEEGKMLNLYREIELPLSFTLYTMELYGIRADREALKAYGEKVGTMVQELEKEIFDLAGEAFNINSPKQLGVILFEKLKLPAGKKTKTGYSTSADVLEKLRPDYPIVGKILDYRTYAKLKSTYADGLAAYIKEDGRIHGIFNQTITATGRLSSTEPNLQNIPVRIELGREIRKIFVPKEGSIFVDADYSQIELRVLAHMSGDERLINAYNQAQDIHAITASQVFHVPLEEVTPQLRRNAKAVNFGIVYGISAFGLSEDLSISRKEAQEYMNQYFKTYPSIKNFLDHLVESAKKDGMTRTLYGRIRPMPELKSSNFMQRSFGERVAMNAPIQGTAADIIKIAMIRVDKRIKEELKASRLILQIHDELLIEAALEEKEKVEQILREEMTGAADLAVRLEIGMESGSSWYETK